MGKGMRVSAGWGAGKEGRCLREGKVWGNCQEWGKCCTPLKTKLRLGKYTSAGSLGVGQRKTSKSGDKRGGECSMMSGE